MRLASEKDKLEERLAFLTNLEREELLEEVEKQKQMVLVLRLENKSMNWQTQKEGKLLEVS